MIMDKASVARFISLIVGLLAYFGINIPEDISEHIVAIVVSVWALYTAWKNNNLTKEAREAQAILDNKKRKNKRSA